MTHIFILIILFLLPGLQRSAAQVSPASRVIGTGIDADINGNLYLLNSEKNTLRRFSKDFVLLTEIGGSGWGDNRFDQPLGMWARNGLDVFVADYGNHRIQRFDRNLTFVSSLYTRDRPNPDERFGYPTDVALSRLGDLFICDGENSRIIKINGFSKVERNFGGFDAGRGRLRAPTNVEIGPQDRVYVQDGRRVVVFDSFGNFLYEIGEGTISEKPFIFADNDGLIVLNGDTLLIFDQDDRLFERLPLLTLMEKLPRKVRSIAATRGTLFLLASEGVFALPDPRREEW